MKTKIRLDKKQKWVIAICAGVIILLILMPADSGQNENDTSAPAAQTPLEGEKLQTYIETQEKRLTEIISKIDGAGEVTVMITAKASEEVVVGKDITSGRSVVEETDSSGGSRKTDEENRSESSLSTGSGEPYVVKTLEPEIEGVAVAAQGAGNPEVVREIMNTVSVLYDVPVHKIKVVKMA